MIVKMTSVLPESVLPIITMFFLTLVMLNKLRCHTISNCQLIIFLNPNLGSAGQGLRAHTSEMIFRFG